MSLRSAEIVEVAYELLLSREPDPAGLKHWTMALENGLTKDNFIRAVLTSAEFREKSAESEQLQSYENVDLIIPFKDFELRVPASDQSLVPHLLKYRSWEPHLTQYLTNQLRPDHVFFDVGANIGYFTVLCAPRVERVVAFEPGVRARRYCERNIILNDLRNVDLHAYGLWHEDAKLHLRTEPNGVNAAITASVDPLNSESIDVVSLDKYIADGRLVISRLDVMKMDVEGAELLALKGMLETIARFRPTIVMELNRPMLWTFDITVEDIWQFLQHIEYDVRAFEPWQQKEPVAVSNIGALKDLCPEDGIIDLVVTPRT